MSKPLPQITLFCIMFLFLIFPIQAQDFDTACISAEPFCSAASVDLTFANTTGDIAGLGEVGCLNTTPNPSWYFLRIRESGPLVFDIVQWVDTDGDNRLDRSERQLDVDFIAWGPFPTSFVPCDTLSLGCDLNGDGMNVRPVECENNADAPDFYIDNADNTNIIDCSYARTPDDNFIETFTIADALADEYYLVLVTNFADEAGVIQLEQTNLGDDNAGTTDCSVLEDGVGPDIATCADFPITIQGRFSGAVTYQWSQLNTVTGVFVPLGGETMPFYEVNASGVYQLEGFDVGGVSVGTDDLQVLDVSTVVITPDYTIAEGSFNGEYTVTARVSTVPDIQADGFTNFEYRLDRDLDTGSGFFEYRPFQSSPIFSGVPPGDYQIAVRYADCPVTEAVSASIMILGYPKYFTPNGDDRHDTWNIINADDQPVPAIVYIFDKTGKLLKQINPGGAGWDGTYNGNPMPSSQYWFRVEYNEQLDRDVNRGRKSSTGGFVLIR